MSETASDLSEETKEPYQYAEQSCDHLYQQTVHVTSGITHHPSLFDVFRPRAKSDARPSDSKKNPSLFQFVKTTFRNVGSSKPSSVTPKDGSAHPYEGSDIRYYHTVTAASTARQTKTMTKVMDIFRSKPSHPQTVRDKRRQSAVSQLKNSNMTPALMQKMAEQTISKEFDKLHIETQKDYPNSIRDFNYSDIIYRISRALPKEDPFLEKKIYSESKLEDPSIFVNFFKAHNCHNLIPTSAKLIVLDTQLLVKKAFYALISNGIRAAPLWDSALQQFIGMLTITDFISMLNIYFTKQNVPIDVIEDQTLQTWHKLLEKSENSMKSIHPDCTLFEAIEIILQNHIHRLPIIHPVTGNVLYILTLKRIFRFMFLYISKFPLPTFMSKKISELNVGTHENIETVFETTSVIEALKKFLSRRVSSLPIIDHEGKLQGIYAKSDVISLAANKTYNDLNMTLKEANSHRKNWFEGLHMCSLDESLYDVISRIVYCQVHRLIIVDDEEKVIGIISLSDLMHVLVIQYHDDQITQTV